MHDFSKQVSTQKANVSYEKPLYQNILQLANIVSRGLDHAAIAIDIDLDAVGVVCILSCLDSSSQWRRQKWAEGVCLHTEAISISPYGFENIKTPLSRQCSQKKKGVRGSENSTEGGNIQSISISPSGFENLTTPLSRQCSQKKMRTELGRRFCWTGGGVRES